MSKTSEKLSTSKSTVTKKKSAPTTTKKARVPSLKKEEPKEIISPLIIIKLWLDGWKKTFKLRGRTSRFELWIFILVNSILSIGLQLKCSYVLSSRFLRDAKIKGYSLETIDNYVTFAEIAFYLVLLIPLFPLGSMLIRRMHDIGKLAWKNYLEPAFMGMVVLWALFLGILYINNWEEAYSWVILAMGVCFTTTLYAVGYYILKFLIPTLFYQGDKETNAYGKSQYNTDEHENIALKFSCIYFLFIGTIGLLYLAIALI